MRRGGRPSRGRGGARSYQRTPLPVSTPSSLTDRGRRDSDASIDSRPSSVSATPFGSHNANASSSAMLRYVNSFLSSINSPLSLKPPIPSAREIFDALSLITSCLGLPLPHPEHDLPPILRSLSCPFKLPKSALRNPATPHAWPSVLGVLYFLAEIAFLHAHLDSSPSTPFAHDNHLLSFSLRTYALYIAGDDDAVEALDAEYLDMAREQVANAAAAIEGLEEEAAGREARAREARNAPTPKEALERERDSLAGDVVKFRAVVEGFSIKVAAMEELVEADRKKLEAKEAESARILAENEELRGRIAGQAVDVEGVEKIRKELGMMDRDVEEAKSGRKALEEKTEELDVAIGRKLKEALALEDQCNGVIRKLKLCNDFQYMLNVESSSPLEVLGAKYKSVLKPASRALAEVTKKSHMEMIDLKIDLQQQLQQQTAIEKEKKEHAYGIQAKIEDANARVNSIKKNIEDHCTLLESEAEKMIAEAEARIQQLEIVEQEAREFQKSTEVKLQEEKRMRDESIQMCARELLAFIDLISNYKEGMESTISGLKSEVCETIKAVAEAHKASFTTRLSTIGAEPSRSRSKRVRRRPVQ